MSTSHPVTVNSHVLALVHDRGAAGALAALRADRPVIVDGAYHDTRAVFLVWAVDRLVSAGLSDMAVLWHPLVHVDSPLAWWPAAVLESDAARTGFVAPVGLAADEPRPAEPTAALIAA